MNRVIPNKELPNVTVYTLKRIQQFLQENKLPISASRISQLENINFSRAKAALAYLESVEKICRVKVAGNIRYFIKKEKEGTSQ